MSGNGYGPAFLDRVHLWSRALVSRASAATLRAKAERTNVSLRNVLGLWAVLAVTCTAPRARADETRDAVPPSAAPRNPSLFELRWTPLEIQSPGLIGGSGGLWVLVPRGIHHRIGLATDIGLGLGGVDWAVGPGLLRPEFEDSSDLSRHEKGWSLAVQGLVYRTWPGWTPRLPTSTTYIGADLSAGYVMYRCWLGAMRPLGVFGESAGWIGIGGIGIGLP
jgi:hypothetical protein